MNKKIYFLSLGCPRNLVDSEVMLGYLRDEGYKIVDEIKDAQVAVINTCTFIDDATQETIDVILDACKLKKTASLKKVIISGCFVQRFGKKLIEQLPEVDGFLGSNEIEKISQAVSEVLEGKKAFYCFCDKDFLYKNDSARFLLTPKHFSYLKICEGCRQACSFCIIPKIKGRFRSRRIEDIVKEASKLAGGGCKELNVVGQDTTYYGFDLYGKKSLSSLLKELNKVETVEWIRLLYAYPEGFSDDLIDVIASSAKICKYIDMPVQHISPKILKAMNRITTKDDIIALIKKLRSRIKGVCLRTSLLVGFPGETQEDFKELLEFMKWAKFERLGIFKYSLQEGTAAASFKEQVPEAVKEQRFKEAFSLQEDIAASVNKRFLGRELDVIIDEVNDDCALGRSEFDAPEVDGIVFLHSKKKLKPGDFVKAKIIDTLEYDLVAKALE